MAECFVLSALKLGANKLSASKEKQKYSQKGQICLFLVVVGE